MLRSSGGFVDEVFVILLQFPVLAWLRCVLLGRLGGVLWSLLSSGWRSGWGLCAGQFSGIPGIFVSYFESRLRVVGNS